MAKVKAANNCLSYENAYAFFLQAWTAFLCIQLTSNHQFFNLILVDASQRFQQQWNIADMPRVLVGIADKLRAFVQYTSDTVTIFDGECSRFRYFG